MRKCIRLFFNRKETFLVLSIIVVWTISACEKHVTPSKVERKITVDSWQITSFTFLDSIVQLDYTNKLFGFGEGGGIIIQNEPGTGGHWSLGLDKKPTILYINGFLYYPYTQLNDDWEVTTCSDSKFTLLSENGSYTNSVTFMKLEN